ncbi:MAG: hypothetical protein GX885_09250 [Methanomicrobiales archaeon]|nr:hypothetical protein [Methanomicrobiales archaeon]
MKRGRGEDASIALDPVLRLLPVHRLLEIDTSGPVCTEGERGENHTGYTNVYAM